MGRHNCNHNEDAGVICSESLTKPTISMNPVGELNLDQSVNITCSISTRIYDGTFYLRKIPGHSKMTERPNTNSVTFNIHRMSFDDEGLYACQFKKSVSGQVFRSPRSDTVSLSIAVRLQQPSISLTSPNRGLVWSPEGAKVTRGYRFIFICSINSSYSESQFFLISSDSTIVATKPAINHSASFDFPVAEYKHQGNYSCVYEVQLPTRRFNSTETGAIRVVIKCE
nr:natural cytotoxicity triggering receptor 1-like [Labrus bergylta]